MFIAKKLSIAELGNPILRKKTSLVKNIFEKDIQKLIKKMTFTVQKVNGVGLAAPQVYESKSLFILASHSNPRYPDAPNMISKAIINPKIISYSKTKTKDWEGCLSIPGIRGLVPRYNKIDVEYLNSKNEIIKTHFSGFLARVFQHEYDHLKGIVFLDRLESNKDIITEKEYQKKSH